MVLGISWQEWLGYLASALILTSLSMSSIARLRWFNLAGSVCFAIYGVLIDAWPVALMNSAIACVNVYYLTRLYTQTDYFKTLEIGAADRYLAEFLDVHGDDIRRWYPNFDGRIDEDAIVLLILRNTAVAGVFAGTRAGGDAVQIVLDYVIREYADHKLGRFLYQTRPQTFTAKGCRTLFVDADAIRNQGYFLKMGFVEQDGDGPKRLVLDLGSGGTAPGHARPA